MAVTTGALYSDIPTYNASSPAINCTVMLELIDTLYQSSNATATLQVCGKVKSHSAGQGYSNTAVLEAPAGSWSVWWLVALQAPPYAAHGSTGGARPYR